MGLNRLDVVVLIAFCTFPAVNCQGIMDENQAWLYLEEYSKVASIMANRESKVEWAYATNITEYNQQRALDFAKEKKPFVEQVVQNITRFDFNNFANKTLKNVFKRLASKGYAALDSSEYDRITKILSDMETIYGSAKLCKPGSTQKYNLEPELAEIFATSRSYDELLWAWKNWRDQTGKKMRNLYLEFVALSNKAAKLNGYKDTGETWTTGYQAEGYNFKADIERLYLQLEPFYKQLHKYMRHKLKAVYGADKFPKSGHIPAHILGNMWAQQWTNVEDLAIPFNGTRTVNATPAIQKMTVNEMFRMADSFFTSVGLKTVTEEFWNRSMLEKPADGRDVVCHASAWDFSDGVDFRIKQCTRKNMEDFITVHHELGHIQYYLQYKDLLYPFRQGANPGFHEAVGDVLALSVSTPKHLKTVNLIESYTSDNNSDINYLMGIALEKIVFLPFGKLMDDYRWSIFDGSINPSNLNAEWWKRRCRYQGVSPPVERTEQDFDAGAKYHIPANVPYVRYFVSFILQFQFHKALCESAGQTGSLHTCDIYNSTAAGEKLGNMLKLGSSRDWQDALEAITGSRSMSAEPILEYFKPLIDWLNQYNSNIPDPVGWDDACPTDIPKADTAENGSCDPINSNDSINSGTFISITKHFISLLVFLYCLL